jgi:hypothetical protein
LLDSITFVPISNTAQSFSILRNFAFAKLSFLLKVDIDLVTGVQFGRFVEMLAIQHAAVWASVTNEVSTDWTATFIRRQRDAATLRASHRCEQAT